MAQIEEEIKLAWNAVQAGGITKGWDNATKASALNTELMKEDGNASATWNTTNSVIDVTYKGYETTINTETGSMTQLAKAGETPAPSVPTSKRTSITPAPTGATYTEGQEVTFGNEKFFVISDDGTTVKLLAKYCLNRAATEQLLEDEEWYGSNYSYYGYGKPFSNTWYWESDITNSDSPIDLQTESMIEKAKADGNVIVYTEQGESSEAPNVIVSAINYGTLKGVKGRLMTYSEADTILKGTNDTMKNLILGCWDDGTEPSDRYLKWWLGDALNSDIIYSVDGNSELHTFESYSMAEKRCTPCIRSPLKVENKLL